ncbi:MAG: CYTH domain-containing protein [Oscillospiraceae bacterium]|nr:CYTH domain-containing protein [Oscillospiraceae bacterium]
MEIERKFLIDGFPNLPVLSQAVMEQGYLTTEPVVRIRSKKTQDGVNYKLCIKGKGTLVREEIETPITQEVFEKIKRFIGVPLIRKEFREYSLPDGLILEVSCVDEGEPTQFYYAEVEFDSVEAANKFTPPEFLGKELTEDPTFTMSHHWRRKLELYSKENK